MGLRNTLASWLLGSEYNYYTEMATGTKGMSGQLFDDRVVQACENATRLTAYTASRCNVSVEGDLGRRMAGYRATRALHPSAGTRPAQGRQLCGRDYGPASSAARIVI